MRALVLLAVLLWGSPLRGQFDPQWTEMQDAARSVVPSSGEGEARLPRPESPAPRQAPNGSELADVAVVAHDSEDTTPEPPRFLPAAWFLYDEDSERLQEGADIGTQVRFWTLKSTVREAEHIIGPLVGLRSIGIGWSMRFRDGSFMLGAGLVVETDALFDSAMELRVRPAVTLSLRREGGEEQ